MRTSIERDDQAQYHPHYHPAKLAEEEAWDILREVVRVTINEPDKPTAQPLLGSLTWTGFAERSTLKVCVARRRRDRGKIPGIQTGSLPGQAAKLSHVISRP